jgi:micrococcal nuclease
MKTKKKAGLVIFILSLAVLTLLVRLYHEPAYPPITKGIHHLKVKKVIDGDTIIVAGGEKVRYIGIDTPELGEPFYNEAKERNRALVEGKQVIVKVCAWEQRDRYGRVLAWVYAEGIDVGGRLLKEGLARTLTIPPCGLKKADEFKSYQQEAMLKGIGLWGLRGNREEGR